MIFITKEIYNQITNTIGTFDPESGGIIAINKDGIISDFYYDINSGYGKRSYIPSQQIIQNYINSFWSTDNLRFCGIVHSHPLCNICEPSYIDLEMAAKIKKLNNMERIYLIIVKQSEIRLFCVDNRYIKTKLCYEEELVFA